LETELCVNPPICIQNKWREIFKLHIADHYERLVQQLGLNALAASQKQNTVKAPMPGLVLNLMVEAGASRQ
jgi:biotin carboxyl carrier protein